MRISLVILSAALLSACASSPNKIQASYVSPLKYRGYSCGEIDTEMVAIDQRAAALHKKLRKRADTDAFNMTAGLVLVWPALLFLSGGDGPAANEYAQLKGERDAILKARENCAARDAVFAQAVTPGTKILSRDLLLVPAATASGYCIRAPEDYRGSGAMNAPAITSAMPRCVQ